jgi:hypothetical protein
MLTSWARRAHPLATALFAACVVVQVFLAGLGVFDGPGAFVTHREFGFIIGWFTLAVLVLALVGRLPRRLLGMSATLLLLFALQSVFVALRGEVPAIAALHPLNGFAILALAVVTARASWAVRSVPAESSPAPDRGRGATAAAD